MTWAYDSTSRTWTKTGAGTEAMMVPDAELSGSAALRLELFDTAKPVQVVLLASPDGGSGIRVGVVGSNIIIRSWAYGVGGTTHATAAHGLTAAQPYTLEVQRRGNIIEAFLNGSTTAAVSWTNSTGIWEGQEHYGFVGHDDGARVARATVCGLKPSRSSAKTVLLVVCNGGVYAYENRSLRTLATAAFGSDSDVWAVVYNQKVYAGDGRFAKIIDPLEDTVEPWTPTAGYLPGQDTAGDATAGKCSATAACVFFNRIALAGSDDDPQNILLSKIDDPLDWDTAADSIGRAYGNDTDGSKVGEPVRAMVQAATGELVIGCENTIPIWSGDPTFEVPRIVPAHGSEGISSATALIKIREGVTLAHSPSGLFVVAGGQAIPFSQEVLTDDLRIDADSIDDYHILLGRDPKRQMTHVFLTSRASGASVHIAYDERAGNWAPNAGPFLPETFPDSAGPTAVGTYQGRLVLGTRDGHLLEFDDEAEDDDGTAIDFLCSVLVKAGDGLHDTIIDRLLLNLAKTSDDARISVYGGMDPEEAFDTTDRRLLLRTTVANSQRLRPILRGIRSPALVIEIEAADGGQIDIEGLEGAISLGRLTTRRLANPMQTQTLCPPPTPPGPASGASGFSSGPGEGGSGDPDSCTTVDVVVGSTTYQFGYDSVVTGVLYGRCRDSSTSTGDCTLNNGWSAVESYAFPFTAPTANAGACRWTFQDSLGTSWVQFNTDGTWTYDTTNHQSYYSGQNCSAYDGDEDWTITHSTDGGPGVPDALSIVDNSDPSHPTCDDMFGPGSNGDIGLFADFDLDNGCFAAPADEATGFRHYLGYTVAGP